MTTQPEALLDRLSDEADLCRNDGADDIARLLDEAAAELRRRHPRKGAGMTQEDLIRMAREANRYASNQTGDSYDWQEIRDERFAALVAAAEREACAAMAEAFHHHQYDFTGNLELHEAIRARGQ